MRSSNRAVRGACLSLAALIASFVLLLPNSSAQAVTGTTQNNGCLGVTGSFSQFAVPITGTAAPSPVTVPNAITLSSTSVQISVDSTLIGAGVTTGLVSSAASLADIGTAGGAGVNAVTAAVGDVKLKINGTNTVEGVQTATNPAPVSLTFYVVQDSTTLAVSVYTALSSPPSATADPARTGTLLSGSLPVLIPLGDTTWTPTGGDAVFSEQNVAPSNLLTPNAADQAAAPLILLPKINGRINVPFKCWPGTVATAPSSPLTPGPSLPIATVTVIGGVTTSSTSTTTTAPTTTTTTAPTTTAPTTTIKTATAVTGTGTYVSTCSNSVTPDKSKLTFAITGTAPSDAVAGNTVTLSQQSWTVGVPGSVLDTGINLGLLQAGQLVNGTVTGAIFATNTKEGTVTAAPSPVQFGPIVVDSVSGKAAEGKSTFAVADMTWTAVGGDVVYVMAPTSVQVSIGQLKVNFNCTPDDTTIQIIKTTVSGNTGVAPATQVESASATRALANTGPRDVLRNLVLGLILLNLGYLLYSAARPPRRQTVG